LNSSRAGVAVSYGRAGAPERTTRPIPISFEEILTVR
jgi:hypothetical protein